MKLLLKLPGLLLVGFLGYLAWKRLAPLITQRIQEATTDYPPPAAGPWSGPTGVGDDPAPVSTTG